jgi:hypothetical protein
MSRICSFAAWLVLAALVPGTPLARADMPFRPGETLTFTITWTGIPAGTAVIQAHGPETVDGAPAQHFSLTIATNSFADAFFKVRDRNDSYTDPGVTRSVRYTQKQQEGRYERDIVVAFDWDRLTAQYFNKGEPKDPIPILPGSLDPLSIFYYFRLLDLEVGTQIDRPVTDGRKCVLGKTQIVKRETLELESGVYDTFLVEPDLSEIGGVFKKSKNAKLQVWVTADKRRLPVRIKSKVVVGFFSAELTHIDWGRDDASSGQGAAGSAEAHPAGQP